MHSGQYLILGSSHKAGWSDKVPHIIDLVSIPLDSKNLAISFREI